MKKQATFLSLTVVVIAGCGSSIDDSAAIRKSQISDQKGQALFDWCEYFGWYGDGICDSFCTEPDPDCAPSHPTDHRPYCGAIGSRSEGWYWGDTEKLIEFDMCADDPEPECGAIGSRSEGWYADGLITWDFCHQLVGISLAGEACGGDSGMECHDNLWCDAGVCRMHGFCDTDDDCTNPANPWVHVMCAGWATCEENRCAWHCGAQPAPGPWAWTTVLLRDIESEHPYANNTQSSLSVERAGADKIKLHFQKVDIERGYDTLVLSGRIEESALLIDGVKADYWTPEFRGDAIDLAFTTDHSVTGYGFRADSVSYYHQLPFGACHTDEHCDAGHTCQPHQCFNPYEACYGHCYRDESCDDGTEIACRQMIPNCEAGTILAYINSCYLCVDPRTCEPPAYAGSECASTDDCYSGLTCVGAPDPNLGAVGCCVDTTPLPGQGDPCTATADCGEDLVCITGSCSPAWMAGDFTSTPNASIPDNDPAGVSDSIIASCLATVPVTVTADVEIEHTYIGDLTVTITDASGYVVTTLHDGTGGGTDNLSLKGVAVNHTGDDVVNGAWTLKVVDSAGYDTGVIKSWALHITSRWD